MRLSWRRTILGGTLGFALVAQAQTQTPVPTGDKAVLRRLLVEFKKHPDFFEGVLPEGEKAFADIDPRLLDQLAPKVLESRVREFNAPYLGLLKTYTVRAKSLAQKEKELEATPISDLKKRPQLELAVQAIRSQLKPVRRNLFLLSLDANVSVRKALETLTAEDRAALAAAPSTAPAAKPTAATSAPSTVAAASPAPVPASSPPKMPGVFGGTREARLRAKDTEKINLTPVDDEFYSTPLGKKLESDLGGRADAWSYDYAKDEMYVRVGGEMGKVRVKDEGAGVRFIQTRVGQGFVEPKGRDQRVELGAKGRFLTGDKNEQTIFGTFPKSGPKVADEVLPPGHHHGDGHDHGHKH